MDSTKYDNAFLLTGLKQGDPVIFKIIYKLYWQKLYNLASYYLGNTTDAEDIVQDVFISIWVRRAHLDIRTALENYLVRSVKYTSFFYLKIRYRNKELVKHIPQQAVSNGPEEYIRYKSLIEHINMIFDSASQKTKDIFFLSRFNGLTYPEIASRMDISVKTVEYHISQALKRLSFYSL